VSDLIRDIKKFCKTDCKEGYIAYPENCKCYECKLVVMCGEIFGTKNPKLIDLRKVSEKRVREIIGG